jgi:molecular chaperone GrpE
MDKATVDSDTPVADGGPELELLQEELRQEHNRYLRALADFENYRRRVERDRERMVQAGKRELVMGLLDFIDDFERALAYVGPGSEGVAEGLRASHRRLLALLASQGVTPFGSVGVPFDPASHEAVGSVASAEHPAGVVAEELRPGYRWGEDVLRPAQVRVAS